MGKKLVIVESPAKAKTINKILGAQYLVKASMGHVRDLPERELGIDLEHDFRPRYVTIKSRAKVLQELRAAACDAEAVFLAPDPDREGEAIAWHLREVLRQQKIPDDRIFRVTYNEITAPAIRKAFEQPGPLDQRRVDSQQARRVLDRLVGYKVSALLWRRIRGASSAGRVQSVALRLVCEREDEIVHFQPEEYWLVGARVAKQVEPRDPFEIRLTKINGQKAQLRNAAEAEAARADLAGRTLRVAGLSTREIARRPWPPFITSTLQQAASSVMGMAPAQTMRHAQKLYEGVDFGEGPTGLITYMRTDSVTISREAQEAAREFIVRQYGPDYLPPAPHAFRSREGAQEAHEAIRPTDVNRTPDQLAHLLEPAELKVYRLIWQRFVASQMAAARMAQRAVEIEAVPPAGAATAYLFRASASEVLFPGFLKVLGAPEKPAGENGEEVERLPPLAEGEALDCLEWLNQQKFTSPPPRYSEAALIKALEENGVGRPSTYAQILSTLQARRYVVKEKRALAPTALGHSVNTFLVAALNTLFDVKFTAGMEEALDRVETGAVEWTHMLGDFYRQFTGWMEQARGPDADPAQVRELLGLLAHVHEWAPPTRRGKRTYSDEHFCASVRTQFDEGQKKISGRQVEALRALVGRYHSQIPDWDAVATRLNLHEEKERQEAARRPPSEATRQKLEALRQVQFHPARTVGKKVYDDGKFVASLSEQVEGGRELTPNQMKYADRLLHRYAEQIPDFAARSQAWNLDAGHMADDVGAPLGPLLEALAGVKDWKPAVKRGRRTWDDRAFFESLHRQFAQQHRLTIRQAGALKKLAVRYREQLADFDALARQFELPPPRASKKDPAAAEA